MTFDRRVEIYFDDHDSSEILLGTINDNKTEIILDGGRVISVDECQYREYKTTSLKPKR